MGGWCGADGGGGGGWLRSGCFLLRSPAGQALRSLSCLVVPTSTHPPPPPPARTAPQERHPAGAEAGDQAHAAEQAASQRGARGPARHRGHAGPHHRHARCGAGRCGGRLGGWAAKVEDGSTAMAPSALPVLSCPLPPHPTPPPPCDTRQASTRRPLCRSSAPSPPSCATSSTPAASRVRCCGCRL